MTNKPWSVQVELTFGCNRRCTFCYRQVLHKDTIDYMTVETAIIAAQQLKEFDPIRIKFAMRGEPTLNPYWIEIISIFRKNLPQSKILVTTNGDHLTPKVAQAYFDSGGNILLIDCYNNNLHKRAKLYEEFSPIISEEAGHEPYKLNNLKQIYLIDNLLKKDTSTRKLSNLASNMTKEAMERFGLTIKEPLQQPCSRPFGEMVIFWDGLIGWCCLDGNADYCLHHVEQGNLKEYWNKNPDLNSIRQKLKNANRNIPLCDGCDYFGGERRLQGDNG